MEDSVPNSTFEMGKLYYERTDFHLAVPLLHKMADAYSHQSDFDSYLKCLNLLLGIYTEQEQVEKINETNDELHHVLFKNGIDLSPKVYYTLALCAIHKEQYQTALEYFEKSLAMALFRGKKEDICHATIGLAKAYMGLDRLEEAFKETHNLQVFFQVLHLPDVKLMSELISGQVLYKMGENKKALEFFWRCYEGLKVQKDLYFYIQILYAMGMAYSGVGDQSRAYIYLSLAKKMIDPKNLIHLNRLVERELEFLCEGGEDSFDLIFKESLGLLTEKSKGPVDFKNQFILMDMLKLFLNNPGKTYSKEDLASKVWRQNYNPRVHNNKIYVTIKRLRKMIEPDYNEPRYIFRTKKGYYLNKSTRVHWGA